jgi:hypothetical protein
VKKLWPGLRLKDGALVRTIDSARALQELELPAHTCVDFPTLRCPACAFHSLSTGESYRRNGKLQGVQLPLPIVETTKEEK